MMHMDHRDGLKKPKGCPCHWGSQHSSFGQANETIWLLDVFCLFNSPSTIASSRKLARPKHPGIHGAERQPLPNHDLCKTNSKCLQVDRNLSLRARSGLPLTPTKFVRKSKAGLARWSQLIRESRQQAKARKAGRKKLRSSVSGSPEHFLFMRTRQW